MRETNKGNDVGSDKAIPRRRLHAQGSSANARHRNSFGFVFSAQCAVRERVPFLWARRPARNRRDANGTNAPPECMRRVLIFTSPPPSSVRYHGGRGGKTALWAGWRLLVGVPERALREAWALELSDNWLTRPPGDATTLRLRGVLRAARSSQTTHGGPPRGPPTRPLRPPPSRREESATESVAGHDAAAAAARTPLRARKQHLCKCNTSDAGVRRIGDSSRRSNWLQKGLIAAGK